jgi:hypothetical protein
METGASLWDSVRGHPRAADLPATGMKVTCAYSSTTIYSIEEVKTITC